MYIAVENSLVRHRYFAKGVEEPLNLNEQSFIDLMMGELGLEVRRKKGWSAWWKEWAEPVRPRDYEEFVEEFMGSLGREKEKKEVEAM